MKQVADSKQNLGLGSALGRRAKNFISMAVNQPVDGNDSIAQVGC
jgi:hypothetical protein